MINPRDKFDWYVVKNLLTYDVNMYKQSLDYKHYFKIIEPLFTDKDIMIFGHTVDRDIKYLNDEAKRYGLPFFDCKFYDAKYMYNTFAGTHDESGVSKICTELGVALPAHEHRSVDDAYATMLIVKEICNRMNVDVHALIEQCEDCRGETKDGEIKTVVMERARQRREELEKLYGAPIQNNFIKGDNKTVFLQFLDGVKPRGEIQANELTGKKLSISLNYEYGHYKQMLSIVQLLANCGCRYCLKASDADYFVTYQLVDAEGNEVTCSRQKYVAEAIEHGAAIKLCSFDELLRILGVSMEDVEQMPYPDSSCFVRKQKDKAQKQENNKKTYSSSSSKNTLGDLLKAQSVDLSMVVQNSIVNE